MIVYALRSANVVIAVSQALKEKMVDLGVPEDHIEAITNGIDTDRFGPMK